MDDLQINLLCSFLTKSDIAGGYIRNETIIRPRDELITERLLMYKQMLIDIRSEIEGDSTQLSLDLVSNCLFMAVKLVQADIESHFISIEPILYDRDSMIKERIVKHYNELVRLM